MPLAFLLPYHAVVRQLEFIIVLKAARDWCTPSALSECYRVYTTFQSKNHRQKMLHHRPVAYWYMSRSKYHSSS